MARKRPERRASQWAELRAATAWYFAECEQRGIAREEATTSWEDLSITARIRRWKAATRNVLHVGNELHSEPPQ